VLHTRTDTPILFSGKKVKVRTVVVAGQKRVERKSEGWSWISEFSLSTSLMPDLYPCAAQNEGERSATTIDSRGKGQP
jgi:hypothetical protein